MSNITKIFLSIIYLANAVLLGFIIVRQGEVLRAQQKIFVLQQEMVFPKNPTATTWLHVEPKTEEKPTVVVSSTSGILSNPGIGKNGSSYFWPSMEQKTTSTKMIPYIKPTRYEVKKDKDKNGTYYFVVFDNAMNDYAYIELDGTEKSPDEIARLAKEKFKNISEYNRKNFDSIAEPTMPKISSQDIQAVLNSNQ